LVKDYKALEDFNKKITEERNKYLEEKNDKLTKQLKDIRSSLFNYNEKRNQILSVLQDKDSFSKFKTYQINLTKVEGEISRLEEKLKNIDKISSLNEIANELTDKLEHLKKEIKNQISSNDNQVAYHKNSFYRFVYHDGALEGLDNRKKTNYINIIRKYCMENNLQYIFSAIEHDVPKEELLNTFSENEICLTLNDSGDDGKLFGFGF
jgi:uncharacterized protein YydD (DUF2326 family)